MSVLIFRILSSSRRWLIVQGRKQVNDVASFDDILTKRKHINGWVLVTISLNHVTLLLIHVPLWSYSAGVVQPCTDSAGLVGIFPLEAFKHFFFFFLLVLFRRHPFGHLISFIFIIKKKIWCNLYSIVVSIFYFLLLSFPEDLRASWWHRSRNFLLEIKRRIGLLYPDIIPSDYTHL